MKGIACLFTIFIVLQSFAQLDTLQLTASEDVFIKAEFQSPNTYTALGQQNGGLDSLMIQKIQFSTSPVKHYVHRSLIQFDIKALPFGAIVTNAVLTLNKTRVDNSLRYIKARMITASWNESNATWAIMSNKTNSYTAVDYTLNTGSIMTFNITDIVKSWQCQSPNFGVMIAPTADNQTSLPYSMPFNFYSSEAANPALRPKLAITYYLPINAVASIKAANNGTSADGAIELLVGGGLGQSYSFQWFDSNFNQIAATQSLQNKPAGVYALKITDSAGGVFRKIYIIPSSTTTTTFTLRPNAEFGIDAHYTPTNTFTTSFLRIGTVPNVGLSYGTSSPGNKAEAGILVDIDYSNLIDYSITNASLTFKEWSTVDLAYSISAYKITNPWAEECLCHATKPTISVSPLATLPTITTNYPNLVWTIDIKDHLNDIIATGSKNYGILLVPDSVMATVIVGQGNAYTAHHAETTLNSNRPLFSITIAPSFNAQIDVNPITENNIGSIRVLPRNSVGPYSFYWGDDFVVSQDYSHFLDTLSLEDPSDYPTYDEIFRTAIDSLQVFDSGRFPFTVTSSSNQYYKGEAVVNDILDVNHGVNYGLSNFKVTNIAATDTMAIISLENGIFDNQFAGAAFFLQRMGGGAIYGFRKFGEPHEASLGHIKFGFKFSATKIYPIVNGVSQAAIYQQFSDADFIEIECQNLRISLLINGQLLSELYLTEDIVWAEEIILEKRNSSLEFRRHSFNLFSRRDRAEIRITDVSCSGQPDGAINAKQYLINVNGETYSALNTNYHLSGNQYSESNTTGDFQGLPPGSYELIVTTSNSAQYLYEIEVAYQLEWELNENWLIDLCDEAYDQLRRGTDQNGLSNSFLSIESKNKLLQNQEGWIELYLRCEEAFVFGGRFGFRGKFDNLSRASVNRNNYFPGTTPGIFSSSPLGFNIYNGSPVSFSASMSNLNASNIRIIRISKQVEPSGYKFEFFDQFHNPCSLVNNSGQNGGEVFSNVSSNEEFQSSLEVFARLKNYPLFIPKIIGRASFGCPTSVQTVLKKELDGGYSNVFDGFLKFKYTEEYQSNEIFCRVYSCTNMSNPLIETVSNVEHGDNRETIDVSSLDMGFYILEVTNKKDEKWLLRFKII